MPKLTPEEIKKLLDMSEGQKAVFGDPNGLGARLAQKAGDYALDKTGNPIAATAVKTAADLAPMFFTHAAGKLPGISAITEETASIPYKIKSAEGDIRLEHPHVKSSGSFLGPEDLHANRLDMSPEQSGLTYENPFYLEDLQVHPQFQNTGVGSKALSVMEQKAKSQGADGVVLNASPQGAFNAFRDQSKLPDLVNFYKRNGYTTIKNEGSNVLMHKPLNAAEKLPAAFSTLSAQVGKKAMPEAQAALANDLKQAGFKFHETQGTYGGHAEPSFMVEHDSSPEAMKAIEDLGKKYNQESVLHSVETPQGRVNELRSPDGKSMMSGVGEGEVSGDYTDSPVYGKFNLNLETPTQLTHYSKTPGLKSIDPNYMGSGVKGAQYKRGVPENKSSFYYEHGTEPEPFVTENSSSKYTTTMKPGQKVYDLTTDPDKAMQTVRDNNNGAFNEDMLHEHLKSQGYDGVKWDNNGSKVIQMYKPMDVTHEEAMAEGGRIGYDEGGSVGLPPGAIPEDQFQASQAPEQGLVPLGAIPADQFEAAPTGPGETLKAGLEGAARGVVGPLAPMLEHKLGGVLNRDIKRRAETPAAMVGETAGLIRSTLAGKGVGSAITKGGEMALEAANLAKPVGYMAKIGSGALQSATEFVIMDASDQASKSLYDPELSAQNAASSIGLAAALGGAAGGFTGGVLSPLWKATVGNKVENVLKGITERYGVEGGIETTSKELADKAGVELKPEFQAVIDRKPGAMGFDSALSQDDASKYGRKYQANRQEQMGQLEHAVADTFGTTADDIASIPTVDKYGTGRSMAESINNELKPEVESVGKAYEKKREQFKNTAVTNVDKKEMADKIAKLSMDEGWHKAQSPESMKFAQNTIESLAKQETSEDLKKFITNLAADNPYGSETYRAAKLIRGIVHDQQEEIISRWLGPQELGEYTALRSQYRKLIEKMENLDTHLKVGRWDGPQGFMNALQEMGTTNGEGVLRRLSGVGKANALEVLKDFPRTLAALRQHHINDLIVDAASKPTAEMSRLNINRLTNELEKMSPQIRDLITTPAMRERLGAIQGIVDGLKDPTHNWSNTARTIHKMTASAPSPLSLLATLLGHGDVGLLTYFGQLGVTEGLPAVRYGLLKFLGSRSPVNSEGFKAMISFADKAIKGQLLMQRATNNVFKSGAQVLASNAMPSEKNREKLDKMIEKLTDNPTMLAKLNSAQTGHYLPNHQVSLSQTVTAATTYLATIKPQSYRSGPLDKRIDPTPEQTARYNRALDIANQPAIVLQHVKDGTVQVTDLQDLQAMYPAVYKQMKEMLTNTAVARQSDEEPIPYKTRMGLSLFLGQAMDATMSPQNIMAAQLQQAQTPPQQQKPSKQGEMKMGKGVKAYMTPTQNAEHDRGSRAD